MTMRIATWNVNSLKARFEKVQWWLERARPDVLLMQETKLKDADAPIDTFRDAGYELAHHGEGRWNGVAIASRLRIERVITNFGEALGAAATAETGDDEPLAEARMIAGVCGGVRVVSLYAPNGRTLGSTFYEAKLAWFARLARWLEEAADHEEPLVL
jgi:exodeoxyribonuclease-3